MHTDPLNIILFTLFFNYNNNYSKVLLAFCSFMLDKILSQLIKKIFNSNPRDKRQSHFHQTSVAFLDKKYWN